MMGRDGTGDPYESGFHSNSLGNLSNGRDREIVHHQTAQVSSLFDYSDAENGGEGKKVVDVTRLAAPERQTFIEKLINYIEEDNRRLLQKLRDRMDRVLQEFFGSKSREAKISIINDVSGIIKPSRISVAGPTRMWKTTLLLALAGKLDQSLKVKGEISYNGYKLDTMVTN